MNMRKYNRIMMVGPSGFGKTTLAKWVSETFSIPFISGSVSDLIPETKDTLHSDMLSRDSKLLYEEDFKILNLRNKLFKNEPYFVSDRSYVDSAAYFMYKQSDKMPSCEIEHFLSLCSMLLAQQCDCLVFLNFLPEDINNWITEDNNKRITSNYYQVQMSSLMYTSLVLMGYVPEHMIYDFTPYNRGILKRLVSLINSVHTGRGIEIGNIDNIYGHTKVIVINEPNLLVRKEALLKLLS